jgi:nitroreductase
MNENMDFLKLAAHSLGVGTTWVMHFIPEAVKDEFALLSSDRWKKPYFIMNFSRTILK